jgi:serine/threonine protein kinase
VGDLRGDGGGSLAGLGPGSRVAGYRLERQVGAGGMAVVFRAFDERLHRRVALKLLAPALAADGEFRQRFLRESQAAAAVDDPHIIPVHDAGEADGVLYLAMRFVPGGDVRTLLRRAGPLPPARVAAIISPVAAALDAAHAAGLVHRDVKPANMLLDTRPGWPDHVYLADFGLSKAALSPAGLTGSGRFLGTADYVSPEQIAGGPVDGRADQYALACAAFELLTGAPPFRLADVLAVIHAHAAEPPPLLSSRRPGLPPEADQVLATALAKDPADRYRSCRDFADALAEALGLAPHDFGTGHTPAATHPPTRFAWSPAPHPADQPQPVGVASGDSDQLTGDAYLPAALAMSGPLTNSAPLAISGPLTGSGPLAISGPLPARPGYADPPGRYRWRRGMVIALAAITIVVLGAATAGVRLLAFHRHLPLSVQLAANSGLPSADGAVYVRYRDGRQASARIYGQISGAKSGEVARLYAQPFPYHVAPAPAGSLTLHTTGATASYAFPVTPSVATRYQVKLFKNAAATKPLATSAATTVYVTMDAITGSARKCRRPVCHQRFHVRILVPAAALATEIAKRWYPYFGLRHAPAQQPPTPQLLTLGAGRAQLSKPRRISSGEFGFTASFSFPAGQRGYAWNWTACTKPSPDSDGIGLPGPNGCGSTRIRASAPGLLPSPCTRYLACAAPAPGVKPAPPLPGQTPTTSPQPTTPTTTRPPPPPPHVTVTCTNPGDQVNNVGDTVSLQIICIDSAGEALTYSGTGLPPGLGISSSGLITGTLTTAGTYSVTVTASDTSGHSGHTTFTWIFDAVTCTNPGDQVNNVGDTVSLQIICIDSAGEALTYSGTGLPPGLGISSSGLITGTLTTAGTYSLTVMATDTSGISGSCSFTWTVN